MQSSKMSFNNVKVHKMIALLFVFKVKDASLGLLIETAFSV